MSMPESRLIVQAFEAAIQPLGERGSRYVLADLPYHGVFLNDPELTLERLVMGINSLFSSDTGRLLLEQVIIELDRLSSAPQIR
jgi:hypothetical protein